MRRCWSIALKDLREFRRDGRLRGVATAVVLVLVVAVMGGVQRASRASTEREEARLAERDRGLGQGDVNPHAAAHYGTFVFAPVEPLAMIDPGVTPYVGAAVFLEAHQQQLARHRPVEDAASFRRLGEMSVASCLQIFVPLFIVLLATAAVTRERERGTWRLLVAAGGRPAVVVAGKALGVALVVLLVAVPAVGVASAWLVAGTNTPLDGDSVLRAGVLLAAYAIHFVTWLALALALSLWAGATRQALVAGVALWLATTVIAPPALMAVAAYRAPVPGAAMFMAAIDDERAARPGWDDRVAAATERFLRGEELPPASNPEVVALIDTEAADTELYGRHFDRLAERFGAQARAYGWLSIVSPGAAVQAISMSMAATDYDHHRHFLEAAAAYRVDLLSALNSQLAAFDSWKTFNAAGSRELWAQVPEFDYDTPPVSWALARLAGAATGMTAWLALAIGLFWRGLAAHGARP